MKEIDNRKNKIQEWRDPRTARRNSIYKNSASTAAEAKEPVPLRVVYGLLKDISIAAKIAQAAKRVHLASHNFDSAEPLILSAREQKPVLVILDWDSCESGAFKILKELKENADLKQTVSIGYLSGGRRDLQAEAQRAGCHRVYAKTEFFQELPTLVARCAP